MVSRIVHQSYSFAENGKLRIQNHNRNDCASSDSLGWCAFCYLQKMLRTISFERRTNFNYRRFVLWLRRNLLRKSNVFWITFPVLRLGEMIWSEIVVLLRGLISLLLMCNAYDKRNSLTSVGRTFFIGVFRTCVGVLRVRESLCVCKRLGWSDFDFWNNSTNNIGVTSVQDLPYSRLSALK